MPVEISFAPTSTNFRYLISDLYFVPINDKLIINPSRDDGELFKVADSAALKLYETLPFTPISAVGYNFAYKLEDDEKFSFDIDSIPSIFSDIYKDIGVSSESGKTFQYSLHLSDDSFVTLNLSSEMKGDKKILKMNYHYQVDGLKENTEKALNKFSKNYQHSKLISSKLITKEVRG